MDRSFVLNFVITGIAVGVSVMGAFVYTIFQDGWSFDLGTGGDWIHASTVPFTALVFVQLVNAFSARSFTVSVLAKNPLENRFLLVAILSSVVLVCAVVYLPFFNAILGTVPLTATDWMVVAIASIVPLGVVEGRKFLRRNYCPSGVSWELN